MTSMTRSEHLFCRNTSEEAAVVLMLLNEELLFYTAGLCHCWCVCLCVCVCVEGPARRRAGGSGMRPGSSWGWQLSRAMRLMLRWSCLKRQRGGRRMEAWMGCRVQELWSYSKLLLTSLYFNTISDSDSLLECAFEPVYWIVDRTTRWLGVVFVGLVILLTASVVFIAYFFVLPVFFDTYSALWVMVHLIGGHYLLAMLVFHYYKATTTSPGHAPRDKAQIPSVTVCKKCIYPKPARTHHCSICDVCVLKMDHHCPWMNTCVGHFNHRYFFCFCFYMTVTCIYCSVSSRQLFLEAYSSVQSYYQTPAPPFTFMETTAHKSFIFLWVLTSCVAVSLGCMTLWHAFLISRGETSVELHINRKETKRLKELGKVFNNPFHYGKINNWKLLLGVEKTSHWLTRVLLPSSHPPSGDGLSWDCSFNRGDYTV